MRTMSSPWARFYSSSCCLCCHVRTGTIILGVWYLRVCAPEFWTIPSAESSHTELIADCVILPLGVSLPVCARARAQQDREGEPRLIEQIINSVVLLILLSALTDPDQYHLPSAEIGGEFEFMDDANMCIATAISLLMILICAMATYGAYKQHAAWIIPFFCYQIFDFALNTLVAISVLVYPNTIQDYLRQLPANFPYKEEIMAVNPTCLVVIILLFISIILGFKGYLISCVWNCYRYINGKNNSDMLVYIATNDTAVLLPPYEDVANAASKDPPPPYVSA
ncbi:lysosomal-associated transmembrane protein 4B isoform X1 [Dermochelys coriacea]|uniref:lysosomal-associated transmembrane protein 4B isoform X1 n=1 Tax=Dermochelys coriacea TaxID=27794 RepID=UPI0018E8CDF8|nr:lysosomal-associated transmembrane protein 4B isoform X1 [Dermochelys coriacea]